MKVCHATGRAYPMNEEGIPIGGSPKSIHILILEFNPDTIFYEKIRKVTSSVEIQDFVNAFRNFFLYYGFDFRTGGYSVTKSVRVTEDNISYYYMSIFQYGLPIPVFNETFHHFLERRDDWTELSDIDVTRMMDHEPEESEIFNYEDLDDYEDPDDDIYEEEDYEETESQKILKRAIFDAICQAAGIPKPTDEEYEQIVSKNENLSSCQNEELPDDIYEKMKKIEYRGVFQNEKLLSHSVNFYQIKSLSSILDKTWIEGCILSLRGDPEKKVLISRMLLDDFFDKDAKMGTLWLKNPDYFEVTIPSLQEFFQNFEIKK